MAVVTDVELVDRAKAGDSRAADQLVRRYQAQAYAVAHRYFLPGGDREDLEQEALIGLHRAIGCYDGKTGSFEGFAIFAARRQIVSAIVAANRDKHVFLNESVRHTHDGHGDVVPIADELPSRVGDPHAALAAKEALARIREVLGGLTDLERRSLLGVANGLSYSEIENGLHVRGFTSKQVDNAITRARTKLRAAA